MPDENQPWILLIPPEIRLHIYSYLFVDGGDRSLPIRNKPAPARGGSHLRQMLEGPEVPAPPVRRQSTKYNVMEQTSMFHRRCYETTYHLPAGASSSSDGSDSIAIELHTAILAACRLLHAEAADALYGRHTFDFGHHIEAVVPFLADRTPVTRRFVRSIAVYKRGPLPCSSSSSLRCGGGGGGGGGGGSDKYEWSYMCRYLARRGPGELESSSSSGGSSSNLSTCNHAVRRLTVVVECGRPAQAWEGVQRLTEADVRLLSLVGHEALEWVRDLAQVRGLEELRVVRDERYLPVPRSPAMVVYAALSASVDAGLEGFLRSEMVGSK